MCINFWRAPIISNFSKNESADRLFSFESPLDLLNSIFPRIASNILNLPFIIGSGSVGFRNVPFPVGTNTALCKKNTDDSSESPDFMSASAIARASFRDMLVGSTVVSVLLGGKLLPPYYLLFNSCLIKSKVYAMPPLSSRRLL